MPFPNPLTGSSGIVARTRGACVLSIAAVQFLLPMSADALAGEEALDGVAIAQAVADRNAGAWRSQRVEMVLRNRRGKERRRAARIYRHDDGTQRSTALFYESPADVRDTAFLTFDYAESQREDDQWLFLPSLGRVRRVSAADRGDAFLATDLTYEDVKKDGKFEVDESHWTRRPDEVFEGHECFVVEAELRDQQLRTQLGHALARIWIDRELFYPRQVRYFDEQGTLLRTVQSRRIEAVDGVWTALEIVAQNHSKGTRSTFEFFDTDHRTELDPTTFTQTQLQRGAPRRESAR